MDVTTRTRVRMERDAAIRRRLGLPSATSRSTQMVEGDRTRRWNDAEIREAVNRLTGGRKVTRGEYKRIRALQGPEFPHHDTVTSRCPDLFS